MTHLAREFFALPPEEKLRFDMSNGKKGGFIVSSHLQNSALEAIVYPLKIREREKRMLDEPITFTEMYKRKMSKDLELARLKKLAKEQQLQDLEKAKLEAKPMEEIFA
ncbi:hypothetical protein F0562_003924 [Nyssa sinensis]|uniref:Uncharacterized protein n=1 Tax=Nyssa sinensis TaxID=561372 RepID=A0A5J5BWT3_9ASTE|nr:hypothetical protein F0562_003924 [Nyssa sinensis]